MKRTQWFRTFCSCVCLGWLLDSWSVLETRLGLGVLVGLLGSMPMVELQFRGQVEVFKASVQMAMEDLKGLQSKQTTLSFQCFPEEQRAKKL